jgi:hypothetical protein
MNRIRLAAPLALLALTVLPRAASTQDASSVALSPEEEALFAEATDWFRGGHYAAAYGRFARLADGGHAPSAALALTMYLYGPLLFGAQWSASNRQQRQWNALNINHARHRVPQAEPNTGE